MIQDAVIWILSWVVDRRLHSEQALRLLLLIAISVLATSADLSLEGSCASAHPRSGAGLCQTSAMRDVTSRPFGAMASYATPSSTSSTMGSGAGMRLPDGTDSPAGQELTDFKSTYVVFPADKDANIEFIWHASNSSQGEYPDDARGFRRGLYPGRWPRHLNRCRARAYPVCFKHLHDHHVREALGVRSPITSSEEPDFVRKFHAAFGAHVMEGFGGAVKGEAEAKVKHSPCRKCAL